jgi:hypothetical protein
VKSLIVILCTYILFLLIPQKFGENRNIKELLNGPETNTAISGSALARAFVLGEKSRLSPTSLAVYLELGLIHLFSLSGLHLHFFNAPFRLLASLGHRLMLLRHPWIILQIVYGLFLMPFWQFPSMRRVLYFCIINNFLTHLTRLPAPKNLAFIAAFILDYLLGSFTTNPYSFTLSFLFLGLLVHHQNKMELILGFLSAYFLLNHVIGQNINYLGFTIGQFFTWMFGPFFLVAMANLLSQKMLILDWLSEGTSSLLSVTHSLLGQASQVSASLKGWEIGSLPLLALMYQAFKKSISINFLVIILSFFYLSSFASYEWSDPSRLHFLRQHLAIVTKIKTTEGEKIVFSGGVECQTFYNRELECQRNQR